MKQMLLGLAGTARSGKDTAADHLVATRGYKKLAFADPLRDMLKAGLPPKLFSQMMADREKEFPPLDISYRKAMQTLGTEWGRDLISPVIWVHIAAQRAEPLLSAGRSVVFSDVRFDDEASFIRLSGGTVVHLFRPDAKVVRKHVSESRVTWCHGDRAWTNDAPTVSDFLSYIDQELLKHAI